MKTNRILPAALAVALLAVGGVTHASAEPNDHEHRGQAIGPETMMDQSAAADRSMSGSQPSKVKDLLTMSQAEQRAKDMVGGGKTIDSERYGIHSDMYKFDIKTGATTKRVFVNGETGSVEVAASLDPGIDPTIVGNPLVDHDEHRG